MVETVVNARISVDAAQAIRSGPYIYERRLDGDVLSAVRAGSALTVHDAQGTSTTRWYFKCSVPQAEDLEQWLDQSAVATTPSDNALGDVLAHAALDMRAALNAVRPSTPNP